MKFINQLPNEIFKKKPTKTSGFFIIFLPLSLFHTHLKAWQFFCLFHIVLTVYLTEFKGPVL